MFQWFLIPEEKKICKHLWSIPASNEKLPKDTLREYLTQMGKNKKHNCKAVKYWNLTDKCHLFQSLVADPFFNHTTTSRLSLCYHSFQ